MSAAAPPADDVSLAGPPARRARLRALLHGRNLPAMLVTRLVNVRYLTGFTGSNGVLLVFADPDRDAIFGTDGRYATQAADQVPDLPHRISRTLLSELAAEAQRSAADVLGFEAHDLTVETFESLRAADGVPRLEPAGHLVEELRTVKDADEIKHLRDACAIADAALAELLGELRPGVTERDFAIALEARMLALGAEAPAFESIVAFGEYSAVPHHAPSARELGRGDFVKLDFGARVAGYHSDMTRTLVLGPVAEWQRELYELVAQAQAAGRAAAVPGATLADVDAAARAVIANAGRGEQFVHPLGHGVGLEIHEAPLLHIAGTDTLENDTPVTIEPGVYLAGRGGVRIEDTIVVRAAGPEVLTRTTRDLVVL